MARAPRRDLLDRACDLDAGQWGVATQSKFLAVGSVVPWAEPGVGAIATQAYANPRYGPDGLALLREGLSAEEVVERLTDADDGRDAPPARRRRRRGRRATFTGDECIDWAGGRTGAGYAAQGNILVSGETVDAIAETFEATTGAARRAPARLPRRGAGRGRRQPRPAVGGAARRRARRRLCGPLRHRRRPARRRPRAPARGAAAASTACTSGSSARHRARTGSRSTTTLARRAARAAARLGYDGELDETLADVGGQREPRGARRRRRASRPVVLEELRRQTSDELRRGADRRARARFRSRACADRMAAAGGRSGAGSASASFGVNAYTAEQGGAARGRGAPRSDGTRSCTSSSPGARLHARRRGARRAGRHARLLPRPEMLRSAVAAEPGTTVLAVGAKPGEAYRPSGWEWAFTGFAKLAQGDEEGARAELEAGHRRVPGRRGRARTTTRASRPASATTRTRRSSGSEGAARLDPENVAKRAPERHGLRGAEGRPALSGGHRAGGGRGEADVNEKRYGVARIEELDSYPISSQQGLTWRPVRRHFGISSFGVNAYTADGGRAARGRGAPRAGRARRAVRRPQRPRDLHARGGGARRAGRHARPLPTGTLRSAFAAEPGTTVLGIGAKPGEVFKPSGWEWVFAGVSRLDQGDEAGARASCRPGSKRTRTRGRGTSTTPASRPGSGTRRRRSHSSSVRPSSIRGTARWAREDEDLVSLRENPRFLAIAGQADAGSTGS